MSFVHPILLVVAALVTAGLIAAYLGLQRRRSNALAATGLTPVAAGRQSAVRRHLPYALFLTAVALLLVALARPQATVSTSRAAGTVILAFDESNSMGADDVAPTRLAAAQAAAIDFVRAQPDTVDIGVIAFGAGALNTQAPSADHEEVIAAINRLKTGGATSIEQAILTSLSAIVGKPVALPQDPEAGADLGYWGSATIVLLSDGEDTGNSDALGAAALAATAGVHIETIGIGTTTGSTIDVDGFQVATALGEQLLSEIAQTTSGAYHPAENAAAVDQIYQSIDLRITTQEESVEVTAVAVGLALVLLTLGGVLMVLWFGRIV